MPGWHSTAFFPKFLSEFPTTSMAQVRILFAGMQQSKEAPSCDFEEEGKEGDDRGGWDAVSPSLPPFCSLSRTLLTICCSGGGGTPSPGEAPDQKGGHVVGAQALVPCIVSCV